MLRKATKSKKMIGKGWWEERWLGWTWSNQLLYKGSWETVCVSRDYRPDNCVAKIYRMATYFAGDKIGYWPFAENWKFRSYVLVIENWCLRSCHLLVWWLKNYDLDFIMVYSRKLIISFLVWWLSISDSLRYYGLKFIWWCVNVWITYGLMTENSWVRSCG